MIVQNNITLTIMKATPAAGPSAGRNRFRMSLSTNVDGNLSRMGRNNPDGAMYRPTASKKGASANANTPKAIAAIRPTTADLMTVFILFLDSTNFLSAT